MAYNDFETSKERGQPVELYEFQYGDDDYLRFTDGEKPVVYGIDTYDPLTLSRTKIATKGRLDESDLTIDVPLNSTVAELFRVYPPPRIVSLTIRQGHIPNPDDPVGFASGDNFPVAWVGTVVEGSRDRQYTKLTAVTAGQRLDRPGLRRSYQWPCNWALYSSRCGADKGVATETGTVASLAGVLVTLEPGWEGTRNKQDFVGGMLEWTTDLGLESRKIRRVDSLTDTLALTGPTGDLVVSDPVSIVLGCRHNLSDCETLHDRVQNYGGQPWIPTVNPVYKNNHT